MPIKEKINLNIFIPASLGVTLITLFLAQNTLEILVFIGVYLATLINLWILIHVVHTMILNPKVAKEGKQDKTKMLAFFIGKILVLFIALSLGVHFVGNKIIIPLLNYVTQIFIVSIAIHRKR